jgi:hypothetical protein
MGLVELTSHYDGRPIAIDPELVGEVKDCRREVPRPFDPTTRLTHKKNRRVSWNVREDFDTVMKRIREASGQAGAQAAADEADKSRAGDGQGAA